MKGVIKKCLVCDKPFRDSTKNHNRLYCGIVCRFRAGYLRKKYRPKDKEKRLVKYHCVCGFYFNVPNPILNHKGFFNATCPECKRQVGNIIKKEEELNGFEDYIICHYGSCYR